MKIELPSSVSSVQDLSSLSLEIHEYAKWFSHNAIKERVEVKSASPPPVISIAAMDLIRTVSAKTLLSQQLLDELLLELETTKKTAPTIAITLAAPAGGETKQALVVACRKNIAENALVSFKFSSTILGGMVITYGSHVFDWSFRRQILASGAKFPEILRNVR